MFYFNLNLALLVVAFFLIVLYFIIRMFFTSQYRNNNVIKIQSRNYVISNNDISNIIAKLQVEWGLEDWTLNYGDVRFYNFGRGVKYRTKEINVAWYMMNSIGYELDYVVSHLWYVKEIKDKHYIVRLFSFMSNWWMKIIPYLAILLFVLQMIIFFYGLGFNKGQDISNQGMQWLFNFPLIFILVFLCLISLGFGYTVLYVMKPNLEEIYTKDTLSIFKKEFFNYYEDFKSARTYSQRINIGYNLAFNTKGDDRLYRWIGPFLNY